MKIGIDLDGVLASFTSGMIPLLQKRLSGIPDMAVPSCWNWSDLGASRDDVAHVWNLIREIDNFYFRLFPTEGAIELRNWLEATNRYDDVIYITSRPQTRGMDVSLQSKFWIEQHVRHLNPRVFVTKSAAEKQYYLEWLGVKAYLDDFAPTVILAQSITKAFLLRQPWNRYDERAYSIPAVWTVKEFLGKWQ